MLAYQVVALGLDLMRGVAQGALVRKEGVVPGGALLSLDTVLVAHLDDELALIEKIRQSTAQRAAAGLEVVDQQVGDIGQGGMQAELGIGACDLVDQEDHGTGSRSEERRVGK